VRRAGRVVRRHVQRVEEVVRRLDLAALGDRVAHAEEHVLDLAANLGDQVKVAARDGRAGERDVDALLAQCAVELGLLERGLALGDRGLERLAHGVQRHAGVAVPNFPERLLQLALATEVADPDRVELLGRRGVRDLAFRLGSERFRVDRATVASASVTSYDAFAPLYDAWSSHMTEDVEFYVDLAREADGPIVELAVGNGRVAVPVAKATGRRVIGIDTSEAMLAGARERAAAEGVQLDLRQGDMRDLSLDEPAALIYCPFRSLLHLPTWPDRRRVFERVAASLRPGGRFAWNSFVLNPHRAAESDGKWHEQAGVKHRIDHVQADNRVDITFESGERVQLWWVTRGEWEALVDVSGLETEALYGWFDRRPFGDDAREFVWVARKP